MKRLILAKKIFMCKLGVHEWEYTPPVYGNEVARKLDLPEKYGYRTCLRCGKKQRILSPADKF